MSGHRSTLDATLNAFSNAVRRRVPFGPRNNVWALPTITAHRADRPTGGWHSSPKTPFVGLGHQEDHAFQLARFYFPQ